MTAYIRENVEKKEHSSISGGIRTWYNHSVNQSGGSSEKWQVFLPEDPAIYYSWAYAQKMPYHYTGAHTPLCTALFVIARAGNIPELPTMKEWIQKMWFIYTMKYYPAINKDIGGW